MSAYNPIDAWQAIDARMGEHVGEDPTEGGLHTILAELELDPEQLTIATMAKLGELVALMAPSGLPGVVAVVFAAGALWKQRVVEGYESPSAQGACPVCGFPAEGSPVVLEDPVLGKTVILSCKWKHRWDRSTGAVV